MQPEESLDIIARMMLQTRQTVLKRACTPFLVWGWVTVCISIAVYISYYLTHNDDVNYLWFSIPVLGTAGMRIYGNHEKMTKTRLTPILRSIWTMFTIVLVLFSVLSFFIDFKVLFIILLLLSIASFTTGAIINYPLLQYCSCFGFVTTAVLWITDGPRQILAFALAIAVMMIYPGFTMKKDLTNERT